MDGMSDYLGILSIRYVSKNGMMEEQELVR